MNIFVGLEFHHRESPFVRYGQHVEHGAIRRQRMRGTCEYSELESKPLVDDADVAYHERLQPALGTQPKQWMLPRPVRMSSIADRRQELHEKRKVAIFQHTFLGADAEDDFLLAAERRGLGAHTRASKFQASPAEGKFRRRKARRPHSWAGSR